jgi:hypothetical protein
MAFPADVTEDGSRGRMRLNSGERRANVRRRSFFFGIPQSKNRNRFVPTHVAMIVCCVATWPRRQRGFFMPLAADIAFMPLAADIAAAPMMPQPVQTMRCPNVGTATSSGQRSRSSR